MIYTIGYQFMQVSQLAAIREVIHATIIDVRSVPYSRIPEKQEFNRNRLRETFPGVYPWKGDILGGKEGPATERGIEYLLGKERKGCRLLLLCVEQDPLTCHRYYDISLRLLGRGVDAIHLRLGAEESGMPLYTSQLKMMNPEPRR
jgi:hypothetical protein